MLTPATSYEELIANFRWQIPPRFNIAVACCDHWAAKEPDRVALIAYEHSGAMTPTSYGALKKISDSLAHALRDRGVGRGDRVALLLPQSVETVAGHFATYKLGAIAVPLAALFGIDALRYRLATSEAKAIITDAAGLAKLATLKADLTELTSVICTDGPSGSAEGWHDAIASRDVPFEAVDTHSDDPALMIFTSGTTGPPKGALHSHGVLLGHLPGMQFTHDFLPQPGDRLWTPSDWAWAGGLMNCLLPGLYFGVPVVFGPFERFDPEMAFALMSRAGVRNAFLPPTALRMLCSVAKRPPLNLRTIGAAGESLGRETYVRARAELGVTVNEFYGQTECNYVLGSSAALGVTKAGAIGRPIPGYDVAVIDTDGERQRPETLGEIAIRRPNPSMLLEYWRDPQATAEKFRGDWMLTGDQGIVDADGFIRFVGRNDDVITSSGYRIGPSEIEDCLATHPAVALAAAVGKPDKLRTEIVKAFVMLKPGMNPSAELAEEIRLFVRARLSVAEYPREIAFIEEIPLTTSGKVIRRGFRDAVRREAESGS